MYTYRYVRMNIENKREKRSINERNEGNGQIEINLLLFCVIILTSLLLASKYA